ncbi:MAG TPA: RNA polymerase sigma factor WhiG [Spirochaetota bacterium]|nr:RNA polymerase sigma factor WhiG [Spirochaetota bacterium]
MNKKKIQELDGCNEDDLWRKLVKSKGQEMELRDYFVMKYSPLVKYVAGKVSMGMPQSIEFDDLVSYGTFGLIDAINKYDPDRGIKFKTYAMTRIRGAIFDELRSIDWIPRSIRQQAKKIEQAIAELENKLCRTVEDEEIAHELGISSDEFQNVLSKVSGTSMLSLNDIWFLGDDSDELSILETLEAPDNMNPDVLIEKEEIKDFIVDAIKKLPDKERKVIVLYYYEDLTLKEIGQVLDVTESRVSQLHTKAIMRLRGRLGRIKSNLVG